LALFCAICGLFTPKVEVSGKEGKIPLSCSELFLITLGVSSIAGHLII